MLRPVKRTRLYEDVVAQIEHLIWRRELCPGARLPSERELVATLGIGRASVREALRTLDSTGLIEVRSGQGAFLRNISLNPYFASIRESLSFLLDVRDDSLLKLWEVRRGLEEQIVLLAAVDSADAGVTRQAMCEHMDAEGEHLRNAILGSSGQKLPQNGFRKLSSGEISRAEVTKSA